VNKRLCVILFPLFSVLCFAQKSFRVVASKSTVEVGEVFELVYSLSSKSVFSGFSDEEVLFPNYLGFRELGTSQSSNISIINGKTTAEISYIKTLQATKVGVFKIESAKIKGKNKQTSNFVTIKVIEPQKKPLTQSSSAANHNLDGYERTFVQWELEKTNPYLHEGILLKLKLYTKDADVIGSIEQIKPPKFEGISTHVIENENPLVEIETINGEEFATVVLLQNIIFVQTTDEIKIESAAVGLSSYSNRFQNNRSYVNSKPIKIQAKPLPGNAPKDFSGAVGRFKLVSLVDKTQLKRGESLSYEIEIIGTGNFDMLKMPEIQLNDSLEIFSPKERQAFEATQLGLKGKNVSTYLIVPQHKGKFTMPPVSFTYFDPIQAAYKTILSQREWIVVSDKSISKKEDKTKSIEPTSTWWQKLENNTSVILLILLIFILFISLIYLLNKRKTIKQEKQKSVEILKIEETAPTKLLNQEKEWGELQNLAKQNEAKLYYEKQDDFINNWLLVKTGLPQSKLTIDLAKEYFLLKGIDGEAINELEVMFNQSKEAKYGSNFHFKPIHLEEEFDRLKNIINKF
jgi:hypothetical protein